MVEPDVPHRRLSDPRELTALAHPVRMGIIELLSVRGPMTATELAAALDESPANCSWHLRKLAEHRFVEEAEGGVGRRRPWRVPGLGFRWGEADEGPEGRRAANALSQVAMSRSLDRLQEARDRTPWEPPQWQAANTANEFMTWLTAEELRAVNAEVEALLRRHLDRLTDPAQRPPGSRLCELVAWGVPAYVPGVAPTPEDAADPQDEPGGGHQR